MGKILYSVWIEFNQIAINEVYNPNLKQTGGVCDRSLMDSVGRGVWKFTKKIFSCIFIVVIY